jgi:hypothetical protein
MLFLFFSIDGKSQSTFKFSYDSSGNRISRTIPLKSAHIDSLDQLVSEPKTFDDLVGDRPIKIYPNPTKGMLKVEIPIADEVTARLNIYSSQSSLIKDLPVIGTFTEIDLSDQPAGMYILRIHIGDLFSEWKIIKD